MNVTSLVAKRRVARFIQLAMRAANSTLRKIEQRAEVVARYDRNTLAMILNDPTPPETVRAEAAFESLQAEWQPRSEYGYDPVSTWKRGVQRSQTLVGLAGMETPGRRVLEVGAGDGMLGAALTTFGHEVTLVDQEDWRDERARSISLKLADCSKKLPFGDASFDLVCSYNSFEHFPDPTVALSEMVRVVRPGGWIYTEFAPLYTGPWGLHAYRTLRMPYPQFLFSEQFVQRKLDELGIWDLGKKRTTLQYLNRWRVQQFEELWRRTDCQIVTRNLSTDESGLSLVIRFPESFRERGLTTEDIVAFGYSLAIRRT